MPIFIIEIRRKYEVPKKEGSETLVMRSSFYATPESPFLVFNEKSLSSFFMDFGCSSLSVLSALDDYFLFSLSGGEEEEQGWGDAWLMKTGNKFVKISDVGITIVPPFSTWASRPSGEFYAKAEALLLSKEKEEGASRSSL